MKVNGLTARVCLLASLALGAIVEPAAACAVCFGDPDSGMARGVVAGVWVLIGVVGFVLTGVAGTGLFWLHRSRVLTRNHVD